ncbi:38322_t:CDS:2, partial [Gigaspora margarita]
NNESNIVYYQFLPFTEIEQPIRLPVIIHVNGAPLDYPGIASFNNEIQTIQFDDRFATFILSLLPGGSYSNGSATVNCDISSSFDISFELGNQTNNQKWRLPPFAIPNELISGNLCSSTITGGAADTNSWIFGSAFLTKFYIVFDQANSQLGIANRSDISYGDSPMCM